MHQDKVVLDRQQFGQVVHFHIGSVPVAPGDCACLGGIMFVIRGHQLVGESGPPTRTVRCDHEPLRRGRIHPDRVFEYAAHHRFVGRVLLRITFDHTAYDRIGLIRDDFKQHRIRELCRMGRRVEVNEQVAVDIVVPSGLEPVQVRPLLLPQVHVADHVDQHGAGAPFVRRVASLGFVVFFAARKCTGAKQHCCSAAQYFPDSTITIICH